MDKLILKKGITFPEASERFFKVELGSNATKKYAKLSQISWECTLEGFGYTVETEEEAKEKFDQHWWTVENGDLLDTLQEVIATPMGEIKLLIEGYKKSQNFMLYRIEGVEGLWIDFEGYY